MGISKLPLVQLIFKGKISFIKGSSDIPLISLGVTNIDRARAEQGQHVSQLAGMIQRAIA